MADELEILIVNDDGVDVLVDADEVVIFESAAGVQGPTGAGGATGPAGPAGSSPTVREVTAAGAITINATTDDIVLVNKTAGAATTVDLPASATRDAGRFIKIVDLKGDADVNNITIDPNGAETILGLSTYVINFQRGSLTIWANPNGGWYV